jgi:glucokinase
MYLAIDIGGTKTLLGVYSETGELQSREKIKTDHDYDGFISSIRDYYSNVTDDIKKCIVGVPGRVNREKGIVYALGNIPWENKLIANDISTVLGSTPVLLENDSRLAGLAEAKSLGSSYRRILYLTISTGIGGALITDGRIVPELRDMEVGKMPMLYDGKLQAWEDFASGQAMVEKYGKKAAEIEDEKTWEEIGHRIATGVAIVCTVVQPEVIVFGGGVGQYANRFKGTVSKYLRGSLHPVVQQPKELLGPSFAEDNVLRGCYELAVQD